MNKKVILSSALLIVFFFLVSFRNIHLSDAAPFVWLYEDKFIHFLSGLVLAWCFASGFRLRSFTAVLFSVMLLGIGWEIYENVFVLDFDLKETAFDVIFDVFGCAVYLVLKNWLRIY